MVKDSGKAFFKLQLVASQKTILAMLEANEEWARAMRDIRFMGMMTDQMPPIDKLERVDAIQKRMAPFMQNLWRFNIVARSEFETPFDDNDSCVSDLPDCSRLSI